ncbi:uncharacterized protein PG986_011379 [Apiospora aurea]|uniref:Uncharacterized protein n=1 Tax=Apiospora aurea TaxID=335848 RepID=A0ABR1Q4W3_9PEZI
MSASVGIVQVFAKRAARNGIRVGPPTTATAVTAAAHLLNPKAAPFVPDGTTSAPNGSIAARPTPAKLNGVEEQEKKEEVKVEEEEKSPEKEAKEETPEEEVKQEEQLPGSRHSESEDIDTHNGADGNNTETSFSESEEDGEEDGEEVTFKLK